MLKRVDIIRPKKNTDFLNLSLFERSHLNHRMGLGGQCSRVSNVIPKYAFTYFFTKESRCITVAIKNQFLSTKSQSGIGLLKLTF